jgi:hypothetical protein
MRKIQPEAGKHDYDGGYKPENSLPFGETCKTFSVGIFRWLPKVNGKGLKRSAVIFRVKGPVSMEEKVYETAESLCENFDSGVIPAQKSCTVKFDKGEKVESSINAGDGQKGSKCIGLFSGSISDGR